MPSKDVVCTDGCTALLAEMLCVVPLIRAADLCTEFGPLIPLGLSLSSCFETFICF